MALAEASESDRLSPAVKAELADSAKALYSSDPNAAVHSAAGQLLHRLGRDDLRNECDHKTPVIEPPRGFGWFVGPNGHTFVVSGPLEGWIGSPADEPGREGNDENRERLHYRRLGHSLVVSSTEVTRQQFAKFLPVANRHQLSFGDRPDHPANSVSWYEAARYCNWLSKEAGIPEAEWCYPVSIGPGQVLAADAVTRAGFRLPTEAEWELLCRSGTITSRPFGYSLELLPRYACTWLNSDNRTFPVGQKLPNELGLFDMLGNMYEWCHDGPDLAQKDNCPIYPLGTVEAPAQDLLHEQLLDGPEHVRGEPEAHRMLRGSAFDYAPTKARSAHRYIARLNLEHSYVGFRIVRTIKSH
jgi:formylglycine-generating enzyme required for sulfatase activity